MKRISLILGPLTAALLGVAVFGMVRTIKNEQGNNIVKPQPTFSVHTSSTIPRIDATVFLDRPEFRRIWANNVQIKDIPGKAIAATVNHHVLASDMLATLFMSLAKNRPDAQRLVILSPDHFFSGRGPVSTHRRPYQTPDGIVSIDIKAVDQLIHQDIALEENGEMYEKEHGIGALIPFSKKAFPKATIVPISIQATSDIDVLPRIADFLETMDDGKTLFIISADMSHYLSKKSAQKNDLQTIQWLETKDAQAMAKAKDTHTDSGRQFAALFFWMNKKVPTAYFTRLSHGISSDYVDDESNTTSYINGVWSINLKTLR